MKANLRAMIYRGVGSVGVLKAAESAGWWEEKAFDGR
jgi:hypothetical protein